MNQTSYQSPHDPQDPEPSNRELHESVERSALEWIALKGGSITPLDALTKEDIAPAFKQRLLGIYGATGNSLLQELYGDALFAVDESGFYECESGAYAASFSVIRQPGIGVLPAPRSGLGEMPMSTPFQWEEFKAPAQMVLYSSSGYPEDARLKPFFSAPAAQELQQNRWTALKGFYAAQHDPNRLAIVPEQPSYVLSLVMGTVNQQMTDRLLSGFVPLYVEDISVENESIHRVLVAFAVSSNDLAGKIMREQYTVNVKYNPYYQIFDPHWIGREWA